MSLKIAMMQPYLFPYIGYMNLVFASDIFIFGDDVNYIKKGWINRNRIMINNNIYTFTVPLVDVSSNKLIKDTQICDFNKFKKNFLRQIELAYKNAINFENGFEYIISVLEDDSENISLIAQNQLLTFLILWE